MAALSESYRPRTVLPQANGNSAHQTEKKISTSSSIAGASGYRRADGRSPLQLRPVFLKVGVIPHAAGSAYVELQNIKVICGVYGPRQAKKQEYSDKGKLFCDLKFAPFALQQRRRRGQDSSERALSQALLKALEVSLQLDKFPKAVIDAYVIVLDTGPAVLSAAVSCVSLALANAGVEMYDLVAACSAVALSNTVLLDPSQEESEDKRAATSLTLSYMPALQQITYCDQRGATDHATMQQMMDEAMDGCSKLHALMQQCLVEAARKRLTSDNATPSKP